MHFSNDDVEIEIPEVILLQVSDITSELLLLKSRLRYEKDYHEF